jgi:amino acid adenylation domain-containing protein
MQPRIPLTIDEQILQTKDLPWLPIEPLEMVKAQQSVLQRSEHFDLNELIGTRLQRQSAASPQRVALTDDTERFTYAELVAAVSQLASFIEPYVSGSNAVIAVSGQRSAFSVIAFLAIETVGGIYLPVDENWPELRIKDILDRSGAALVVVGKASLASSNLVAATAALDCHIVSAAEVVSRANILDGPLPNARIPDPASPRYIVYTSGSTGRPKGAVVEHQGMVNHLLGKIIDLQISQNDCIAQTASLTFDISIWQMLAPLLVGGCVSVLNDEDVLSPEHVIDAIASKSITILEVVPTMLSFLLDEHERRSKSPLEGLRYLVATGEALPPSTARRWIAALPGVPIVNAYGPTECSDDVTHEFVSLPDMDQIHTPIGRPVPNSRLYLLVEDGSFFRSSREGESGELFVGGVCVGRGYLGEPDRTRTAFFRDPFVADESARLYRTGDLVRLTSTGSLEYLGRIDRQVKVGGVRIELGEIEETLRRHELVTAAAVIVVGKSESSTSDFGSMRGSDNGIARLVAYVTGTGVDVAILRDFASDRLPRSMVPTEIVLLGELPLTPNGKIDYQQLESLAHRKYDGSLRQLLPTMYAHNSLLHQVSEMERQALEPGMRALHVGPTTDVALQMVLGLSLGIAQVLSKEPSPSDARTTYEQCRANDISLLNILSPISGDLSRAEAASLAKQLSHVRIDRHSLAETTSIISALSSDRESPVVSVHYDADAVIGVSSYRIVSDPAELG